MRLFGKKSGFSLMEIIIAVLIVAILALAVTPIIGRQMQKSKEYSYYLAYRTLEKMAGQIVMQGEPNSDATAYNQVKPSFFKNMVAKMSYYSKPLKHLANKLEIKWAYTEGKLFSKIFSKTNAAGNKSKLIKSFTSDEFDELLLCATACRNNMTSVKRGFDYSKYDTNDIMVETSFNIQQVCDCNVFDPTNNYKNSATVIDFLFNEDTSTYDRILSRFRDETDKGFTYPCNKDNFSDNNCVYRAFNAEAFCEFYIANYEFNPGSKYNVDYSKSRYMSNTDDNKPGYYCQDYINNSASIGAEYCYWNQQRTQHPGTCMLYGIVKEGADDGIVHYTANDAEYPDSWCTDHGYLNFTNVGTPNSIDCQPIEGYAVTENNEKVAYQKCPEGEKLYQQCSGGSCQRLCTSEAFNEYTQQPCGPNATYNGGETCDCNVGWEMDADGKCLKKAPCPVGTQKNSETGLCVANPPLITGKSLCRLIKQHWNIQKDAEGAADSCDVFSPHDATVTARLYEKVYNAVTKDGKYMSLDANVGAFNNPEMQPNIKLSNGLKLWILGDKAASIPGLSFFNTNSGIKPHQNMCILQSSINKDNCDSTGQGYYCKNDNNCYRLHDDSSIANINDSAARKNLLLDARGCCSANEFGDLISMVSSDNLKKFYQEPTVYAISGFTVFVDIDGDKGSGTLWDDVFPFYIATDGRVYPGYPLDGNKNAGLSAPNSLYIGGNSEQMLPTDVYYYDNAVAGTQLARKTAFSNVSYARAVCSARIVSKHTPYCMNLGEKFRAKGTDGNPLGSDYISDDNKGTSKNPCDYYKCFVSVRNKLRYF